MTESGISVVLEVTGRDGRRWQLESPVGVSMMQTLQQNGGEIEAICGGAASCGSCHVFIGADWHSRLPAPDEVERFQLQASAHYRSGCSRLSCQIQLEEGMNGLELVVAPPD